MRHDLETESTFRTWDGGELYYRAWASGGEDGKALILLHRGHEHSGRLRSLYSELSLDGFSGFAFDLRGHGRSPGDRGFADSYDVWVKDLNSFINHIRDRHGIAPENMAIVANSVGAVSALTWVHDYGAHVRCMVLAAPALRIRLYVPLAVPLLRLLLRINKKAMVRSYIRAAMLTHDAQEARAYDADKLITRIISVGVLLGLHDTATRILSDAGAVTAPTQIFSAGSDYVVENRSHGRLFAAISAARKEHHVFPGMYHGIFFEKNRGEAVAKARRFIQSCFDEEPGQDVLQADRQGYTRREYDRLRAPASMPVTAFFGLQALAMRTLGRLSHGIRLGLETGFNSGDTLDYVYRNQPSGVTWLGRLIDKVYLNSIGWRGIKLRKESLKQWISVAAARLRNEGREARIMDVAAGHGRYLLEIKRVLGDRVKVLLRDIDPANLESCRLLAAQWGLGGIEFEIGDAFDEKSYACLPFRPNITVVSGLYELISDNTRVLSSMRAIAGSLEPGGYLICTGQPWHPQIEMIARTLTNRDGTPWVMRRRSQSELNALLAEAGLQRVDSSIDAYGIFTVTLTRKVG
ncbi:MAG: bifunctional alpha/beta hydrolase/class I SAM-dependent methyltransferase [Syntrophobacteraceae bacterium]